MRTLTPTLRGVIDRRMLVNYRIQPELVQRQLPACFRPQLVNGWAMGGICLIRLKAMRPYGVPGFCGLASENAAHRFAVEWDDHGTVREGVFIVRRDTSSCMQAFMGGRLFPGVQHPANFTINETSNTFALTMNAHDGTVAVQVQARRAPQLPSTSVFGSLADASDFFARGAAGYSDALDPNCCEGMQLSTSAWQIKPLEVDCAQSSLFDDTSRFPTGTIHFDCALLMENLEHAWRALPRMEKTL